MLSERRAMVLRTDNLPEQVAAAEVITGSLIFSFFASARLERHDALRRQAAQAGSWCAAITGMPGCEIEIPAMPGCKPLEEEEE